MFSYVYLVVNFRLVEQSLIDMYVAMSVKNIQLIGFDFIVCIMIKKV